MLARMENGIKALLEGKKTKETKIRKTTKFKKKKRTTIWKNAERKSTPQCLQGLK